MLGPFASSASVANLFCGSSDLSRFCDWRACGRKPYSGNHESVGAWGARPVVSRESTSACAASWAGFSFHKRAARTISEARSLSQLRPTTRCQPSSSIRAVDGVERESTGRIKCDSARARPSISNSGHFPEIASKANSSTQGVFESSMDATSGIDTTRAEPSATNKSRSAVKTGS